MSKDSSRSMRWSRWGVLVASLLVALVLVLPTWFGYVGALDTSKIVARGQGQAIEEGIVGRLGASQGPSSSADLAAVLEALEPTGLRYVEVTGRMHHHAGEARVPVDTAVDDAPRGKGSMAKGPRFTYADGWGRMERRMPPPTAPRARSADVERPGPPQGPRGQGPPGPRRGPRLVFEYYSGPATQLVARARNLLLINVAAAVGVLVAGWFAFLWMRRQERGELARTRERHLATLGEMSAVLAHEIRNPLTSLKGHAQLLAESLREYPDKEAKANRVVNEAIRLETLTSDLLDFVRTGEIHPRLCKPGDILERACADVASQAIFLDVPSDSQECMVDRDRMQQALTNLVSNAVQASDDPVEACVKHTVDSLIFEVRDRGPGIPEAELEHVFDAFHTTKVRGTGLGLAVVRRVVELHKGTVVASNHSAGGAVFRIEIPKVSK